MEKGSFRQAWAAYEAKVEGELREREARAWAVAREAARILRQEFRAGEVWLFGSLARGKFDWQSDVDMAVSGLDGRLYLRAQGRLLSLDPEIKVDLVPAEEMDSVFRTFLEEEAVPL